MGANPRLERLKKAPTLGTPIGSNGVFGAMKNILVVKYCCFAPQKLAPTPSKFYKTGGCIEYKRK